MPITVNMVVSNESTPPETSPVDTTNMVNVPPDYSGHDGSQTHGILSGGLYVLPPPTKTINPPSSPPLTILLATTNYSLWHSRLASKDPQWIEAMRKEIQALEANKTWVLTQLPPGKFPIRNDILITGVDKAYIDYLKQQLDKAFSIKDLRALHYYLGIEFLRNNYGLAMTQRKYTLDLLKLAGILDSKTYATPVQPNTKLNLTDGTPLSDPTLYRTFVRKLMYLTITRPDISFAAQSLSQFLKEPRTPHMEALIRFLRYLKLCLGQVLFFSKNNYLNLLTYCESDWASCSFSRKPISGYCILLGTSIISWQLKKQGVVSRSSTEAEYIVLADNSCEISWLTCLLKDL
ncbi:uncharacterized mitochondrial protein-like protein [Tanacetum coccineum]|uniref:Uncharacterized mitochondrial protein-like protein n=1 Tax=Tanacetum coccineum TaxID=301880 RepID=A0ABQ5FE48_9ASTR